ncbi:hypothetical protein V8C26DRAFT_424654 [Trichoderma gracile]
MYITMVLRTKSACLPFHWLHLLTIILSLQSLNSTSNLHQRQNGAYKDDKRPLIPRSNSQPLHHRVRRCRQETADCIECYSYYYHHYHILHTAAAAASHVERPTTRRLCICFAARPLWIDTTVETHLGLDKTENRAGQRLHYSGRRIHWTGADLSLSCPHLAKPRLGLSTLILLHSVLSSPP